MISSFSQYLTENEKTVYFTFGRMNPPTVGHGKLLDVLAQKAGSNPYRVFVSQSSDSKKNPLSYSDKVKHIRRMFPKHARSVLMNKKVKTYIDAVTELYNEGFRNLVVVVGSDRVINFDTYLNMYNGKESKHGFYNFKSIKVVSAGERDPDADGVEGMSASKQREFAKSNDFVSFSQGLPAHMSNAESKKLFNDVRKGLGLKEEKLFKNHIQLEPVSDLREAYVKNDLFEAGDQVVMLKNERVGVIKHLGTNYVIVESKGETWRCWLNDVAKVDDRQSIVWKDANYGATPDRGPYNSLSESTDNWYKEQPEWGTPESTRKAKSITPGERVEEKDTHITKDGKEVKKGLWWNIHQRRKKNLPPRKPGDKNYPKTLKIEQTSISSLKKISSKGT